MADSVLFPGFPLLSPGNAAVATQNLVNELLLFGWSPRVISDSLSAQPAGVNGAIYLIPDGSVAAATGADWTGRENHWAFFFSNTWYFLPALAGAYYTLIGSPSTPKFLEDVPVVVANQRTVTLV